jgi:hypothetical protein
MNILLTNNKCFSCTTIGQSTMGKLQMHRMVTHHEVGNGSNNRDEESNERRVVETPPDLAETLRSLMVKLQSCKADNERLIKEQEKQTKINAVLLQSLSDIQRQL